jgi:predicted secreted hydrolase
MKSAIFMLMALLVACAPVRQLEAFVERKPDPISDQGAHRSAVEWWYMNGHLETQSGAKKGFAAAIFQVYIPEDSKIGLISTASILPQAFYFGHYSLLNKATGTFSSSERSTLPFVKNPKILVSDAAASEARMDVHLGDWRMTREQNGHYTVNSSNNGQDAIALDLEPLRPEVVHGPGWSGNTETGRMYYYSATRLKVTGTLNGEAVTGIVWFDHQWGGGIGAQAGDGSASFNPNWDWMSLQLEDGRDMMIYVVKNAKNEPSDKFISITDGNGKSTEIRNFRFQPFDTWTSPATGGKYPTKWSLRLEDGTILTIRAVADNQEIEARATTGFNYYEGAVTVTGTTRGVGYMELTGYVKGSSPLTNPWRALQGAGK